MAGGQHVAWSRAGCYGCDVRWSIFVMLCSCSTHPPRPGSVTNATRARPPAPHEPATAEPATSDPACAGVTSPTRVSIQRGRSAPFGAASIAARDGQEDLFADGTSAWTYTFDITGPGHTETWRPDSRDTERYQLVAGLCIRLVDAANLEIAEPEAAHEMSRCAIQCCKTPESRRPAPDGSVECCFCH